MDNAGFEEGLLFPELTAVTTTTTTTEEEDLSEFSLPVDEDNDEEDGEDDITPRRYMFVLNQAPTGDEDDENEEEEEEEGKGVEGLEEDGQEVGEEDAAEIAASEAAALESSQVEQLVAMRLRQLDREYVSTGALNSASAPEPSIDASTSSFRSLASIRPDLAARRPDLAAKIEALQKLKSQMLKTSENIVEERLESTQDKLGSSISLLATGGGGGGSLNLGGVDGRGVTWETFDDFPENYGELQLKDSEAIRLAKEEAEKATVAKLNAAALLNTDMTPKKSPLLIPGLRPVSPLKADTRDAIKSAMARIKISPRASPMAEALAEQALERGRRSVAAFKERL